MTRNTTNQDGFTLVELVVVVMILGILAAIAAPRVLGASKYATDNTVRQTLSVIRGAIDSYTAANEGELPGIDLNEDTFKTDLKPFLRGADFPICPVGSAKNNAVLMMDSEDSPGADGTGDTHSWGYNTKTGDFFINSQDMSADEVTIYGEF